MRAKVLAWTLAGILLVGSSGFPTDARSGPITSETAGQTVSVSYSFPPPAVERVGAYDRVTMPDLPSHGDPRAPVLPYRTARILLPFGMQMREVTVAARDSVALDGVYHVEPGRELIPAGSAPDEPVQPDPAVYGSSSPFPGEFHSVVSEQRLNGYAVLLMKLYPVQYVPRTGQLTYHPKLTVTVETSARLDMAGLAAMIVAHGADRVRALVDNPQLLASYPTTALDSGFSATSSLVSPGDPCDYVVITSQALSSTFESLVDWKVSKGLTARVYATEDIYAEYAGDDDAERIRNFIVDAYTTWAPTARPLQYVVLGGDTEVIPIRSVYVQYGSYSTWMPVDMYYAGLDGDWDADGDGNYGEPSSSGTSGEEVDFFAEVYVGRVPVENTTEAAHAISKTLRYEQNPTADYLDRALWLGQQLDDRTWGGNSKDVVSNLIPRYNVTALYARDGTYTTGKVIDEMNAGVHLVNFDGHGNWSCCPLERSQIDGLTNDDPFLFYNLGCLTAQFDGGTSGGPEAVAEHYVFSEHGAVAYIGNTRYGWYVPGSTGGPGNELDRLFFEYAILTEDHNVGKALQLAKEDYYPGHRWSILTLTLLGDPETAVVTELPHPVANISSPLGGKTIKHTVDVAGTARAGNAAGATFGSYVLDYGSGNNPSAWTQIGITETTPVTDGLLGAWDTTVLADGSYTLRLRVDDGAGSTSSHQHVLTTDNLYITSPAEDDYIQGGDVLTITGAALGTDFTDYEVAYGRGANPSSWTVITTSTLPVADSVLAVWDLSTLTEADDYTIRLTRHGTAYDGSDRVTVYHDPAWQAGWPQSIAYRMVAPTIAAGDIDGDGDLEVVASMSRREFGSSVVYAWHHDGSQVSGWPRYVTGNWASAPALADTDRDGDLEVLVGTYGKKVYAWHHDGREVSGWPQNTAGEVFGAPSVADLNGDGILEIVAAALDGYVYAWHYDGTAVAGWPREAGRALYASPALGDLDGDGDLEVVAACTGTVHAWNYDGSAVAGWPITATSIVTHVIGSPAIGDIDDNGDMEIVLAAGEAVYAWHHDGTSVVSWPQAVSGTVKSSPALGDLDGDGDLEIAVGSDHVYVWHDDGTFVSGWPVTPTKHTNSSPVLGDITGDGQIDVVIGAGDEDDHLYAWEGDGSPITGWPRFVPAFGGSGEHHERLASPILIDLDQDGDVEVAIGGETNLFAFDWSASYDSADMEWPIYQHDLGLTGTYTDAANLPPFVRDVWASPGYVIPAETVTITARVTDEDGVSSVAAEVESPDETVLTTLTLYDDGSHGDRAAGDRVFGNSWTTPAVKQDYVIDVAATDALGQGCTHDNAGGFTSMDVPYVQYSAFAINREDRAPNGVPNPGEFVEGALTLENIGVLGATGVTTTVSTDDACIWWYRTASMALGDIAASDTATSGNCDFYFFVSRDCAHGHVVTFYLDIYDDSGNHWTDRFEVTVIDSVGPYLYGPTAMPRYVEAGHPVTITVHVEDSSGVSSVQATVESPDETERGTVTLYDDGLHGDLGAGDGTYGNAWATDAAPRTYKVDFVAEDELDNATALNNGTEFTTQPFSRTGSILLVADGGGAVTDGFRTYYSEALDAAGASYDVWDTYWYGLVTLDTLQLYAGGAVIWAVPQWGYLYQTSAQEALSAYLDAGGRLFITGQSVGMMSGTTTFYSDYLHADYEANYSYSDFLDGVVGDPIGDGLHFAISGGDGASNQTSPDTISPLSPAVTVLTYTEGTLGAGAIRVEAGVYKVVYFGFGFEAINSMQDRVTVMCRVLDWLLGGFAPSAEFSATPSSGGCPLTVRMTGTVSALAEPYTVRWDFGDGVVETMALLTATHVFTEAGSFDVTLTVENAVAVVSATNTIEVKPSVYLPLVLKDD
jgi:PKD repeat protein